MELDELEGKSSLYRREVIFYSPLDCLRKNGPYLIFFKTITLIVHV